MKFFFLNFKKPPNNETFTNNQEKNNKICDVCKSWRPPRAVHCVSCNSCTLKYDHHCPWIMNCVGLKNHKAFYLFSFYLMVNFFSLQSIFKNNQIGSLQYCWRTIFFALHMSNSLNKDAVSFYFYIYWIMTSIIIFPLTLMFMGSLFFSILNYL